MHIIIDDLNGPEIQSLLQQHLDDMYSTSPPESVHALDLNALRKPEITFWTAWDNNELLGCGALKQLNANAGEIKSMRTATPHLRKGVARKLLQHIIEEAQRRQYQALFLETGSMIEFEAARKLYRGFGFNYRGPFGDYIEDPNSVFMFKALVESSAVP